MKRIPLRYLLPNAVTLCGLYVGLGGVKAAVAGDFEAAARAVALAAVFDALDGRVARMVKGVSRFGAELDSLADFVNFGVVPGLILYFWKLSAAGGLGWAAVLVYITACGLRLARFNVNDIAEPSAPPKTHFTGVPAPAGALLALLPLFAGLSGALPQIPAAAASLYIAYVGALMLSRLPVPALRRMRLKRRYVLPTLLGLAALGALLTTDPWAAAAVTLLAAHVLIVNLMVRALLRRRVRAEE